MLDTKVTENLKKYKRYEECTCLECGYQGMMGVDKHTVGFVARLVFKIILIAIALFVYLFLGKGIVALIAAGLIYALPSRWLDKRYLFCPNCEKLLKRR